MLQDIAPHRLDMTYAPRPAAATDFVVAVKGGKLLLRDGADDGESALPRVGHLSPAQSARLDYLFSVDTHGVHLLTEAEENIPGFDLKDMFVLRTFQPSWLGFAAVTACHLGGWYASNKFCGSCGTRMERKQDERAMRCPACEAVVYPRISPAVIVGVTDGDRILMTRYANRPNNSALTALVAGFMEIGETLEETVAREVGEEVGLKVKNLRYYNSQPWAFSGSVLVGFYADVDGSTEITVDETELAEAAWIHRADLPANLNTMSLTATRIEAFKRGEFPK
jgi:NAD+ diphosphatase